MKLAEYVKKQNENKRLYTEAHAAQYESHNNEIYDKYNKPPSDTILKEMMQLEKEFILEHIDEYANLLKIEPDKNGRAKISIDGYHLFTMTAPEKEHNALPGIGKHTKKLLGIKESEPTVELSPPSSIGFLEEASRISDIFNRASLLESEALAKKDTENFVSSSMQKPADPKTNLKEQLQSMKNDLQESQKNEEKQVHIGHVNKP